MDPLNNNPAPNTSTTKASSPVLDMADDITIENAFVDIIGVVQLSESPDSIYHYFVASPMYAGFGDLGSPERIFFLQDFSKMSPSLRNYLASADTVELIFSIGKEFNLDDSQISELGILVRELLTGKLFIQDFPNTISSRFGIDDIKAGEIANKIISKSFGPIIEDVKRIQRNKFPDKVQQLQKEAQGSGQTTLNQPLARPITPRSAPTPLQSIQQTQDKQIAQQQPTPSRPPLEMPPRAEPKSAPSTPPQQSAPKPVDSLRPNPGQTVQTKPPVLSEAHPTQGRQFKIPDLGQPVSPTTDAQKSLEAELEKVANVIDLRNQGK